MKREFAKKRKTQEIFTLREVLWKSRKKILSWLNLWEILLESFENEEETSIRLEKFSMEFIELISKYNQDTNNKEEIRNSFLSSDRAYLEFLII